MIVNQETIKQIVIIQNYCRNQPNSGYYLILVMNHPEQGIGSTFECISYRELKKAQQNPQEFFINREQSCLEECLQLLAIVPVIVKRNDCTIAWCQSVFPQGSTLDWTKQEQQQEQPQGGMTAMEVTPDELFSLLSSLLS
jgi:hypothetical protein